MASDKYRWQPTDTAAVMFSVLRSPTRSRIIRFSVLFKDRQVDPVILKRAVRDLLPRYPSFAMHQRDGFFWSYLEAADEPPEIVEESWAPGIAVNAGGGGTPDYRILYYGRRITIEGAHLLGDGKAMMDYITALAGHYLTLCGVDTSTAPYIRHPGEAPAPSELENAFAHFANDEKLKKEGRIDCYRLPAVPEEDYMDLVFGLMSCAEVRARAKEMSMTITEYLTAVMIYAVIHSAPAPIKEPISIAVPVNMRAFYPTETLRNFSSDIQVVFEPNGRTDTELFEIVESIRGQIRAKATKQTMQAFINRNYHLTTNIGIDLIPFFVKRPGFRRIQRNLHSKGMTVMLSNLGYTKLPDVMNNEIDRIEVSGGDPISYGHSVFCTLSTVGDTLDFCFAMCTHDTTLPREFFRALAGDGIKVRIESTDGNGVNRYEM